MSHGFSISLCHRENSDNRNYLKWTIQWTYCAKDSSYDKQKAVVSYDFQLQSHKSPGDIFDFRKFGLQFSRWVFFFSFFFVFFKFYLINSRKDLWMHDIIHIPGKREFYTWQGAGYSSSEAVSSHPSQWCCWCPKCPTICVKTQQDIGNRKKKSLKSMWKQCKAM